MEEVEIVDQSEIKTAELDMSLMKTVELDMEKLRVLQIGDGHEINTDAHMDIIQVPGISEGLSYLDNNQVEAVILSGNDSDVASIRKRACGSVPVIVGSDSDIPDADDSLDLCSETICDDIVSSVKRKRTQKLLNISEMVKKISCNLEKMISLTSR